MFSYCYLYYTVIVFFLNIHSDKYNKINHQSLQFKLNYMLFWPFRPAMSIGNAFNFSSVHNIAPLGTYRNPITKVGKPT